MKPASSYLPTYDISEINAMAGTGTADNEFFVFQKKEIPTEERMFHPARSSHFTIYLHLRGEFQGKINLINYQVSQPCLFILPPNFVREKVKESDDCDAITLGFSHQFLGKSMLHKKHLDAFGFFSQQSDPLFLITNEEVDTLKTLMLFQKKINYNHEHPFREELMHHAFSLFMFELAAIAKKYRIDTERKFTRKEDLLFRFIKLLNQHFKEERSVQYYANALYITPKHLTKTLKEITTKTCGDMIDEMVITEAKILLGDMSYSVAQAADKLHFSDQFFFSKFFKKHTGVSPKEYKSV